MPRGTATVDEPVVAETEDMLTGDQGYRPIAVYNVLYPQEKILVEDNRAEPDLAKFVAFNAGVYLCTSPKVEAALRKFPYLYWEDKPAGVEARKCPHCGWSARNDDAVWAHTATHQVDVQ